jgi:hypothetical protein
MNSIGAARWKKKQRRRARDRPHIITVFFRPISTLNIEIEIAGLTTPHFQVSLPGVTEGWNSLGEFARAIFCAWDDVSPERSPSKWGDERNWKS